MDMNSEEQLRYNAVDLAIRSGATSGCVIYVAGLIEQYIKEGTPPPAIAPREASRLDIVMPMERLA